MLRAEGAPPSRSPRSSVGCAAVGGDTRAASLRRLRAYASRTAAEGRAESADDAVERAPLPAWQRRDAAWFERPRPRRAPRATACARPASPRAERAGARRQRADSFDQVAVSKGAVGAIAAPPRTFIAPTVMPAPAGGCRPGHRPDGSRARAVAGRGSWRGPLGGCRSTPCARSSSRAGRARRPLDLGVVVLHDGPDADALCRELGAEALALGRHVASAAGRFRPDEPEACRSSPTS
ncbi:MAG: DUF4157 domain-containing protein [Myxococcota bacterium]